MGLGSTSLRSELPKPQQIFSTSAKLSSKSALICFIREGQDKYNKRIGKNYTNAENINFLLKQKINILCIGIIASDRNNKKDIKGIDKIRMCPRVGSKTRPIGYWLAALST